MKHWMQEFQQQNQEIQLMMLLKNFGVFWINMELKKNLEQGYSIGIGYPPDWGEQTLNISKGDKTILQPNVTFHMIAVMQFGEWGVEASESVRVT